MPSFLQNILALPAKTKALLGVSTFAVLAIAFIMLKIATAPSYALIASGLDPAETGKITAALDEQGIAYELLDQSKLGSSQFQQQVTYQRALEGEIARTINGVEGVSGATVQIVMPQDDLFEDTATPATAAVMLQNSADTLQPGAVRGIAQLTSSSVKGLKTDNVTITDGSGQLLWPTGDGTGGATKLAAEATYDRQLETQLNAVLIQTLGPGKAQVKVNADLNMDKTSLKSLTYAKKGVPLKTTSDVEKLKGGNAATGGTAGTGSNIPTYSAGSGNAAGASNYDHTTKSTDWGVDKTVKNTDLALGAVNKLNVALMVDKSVPPATVAQLKQTIAAAAGVQTARGDTIQAAQMAFAKPVTPKTGPVPTTLLAPLKWVGLGLASLLFLFFMTRGMRRREGENLGTPSWLTEIEEPMTLAQLEQRTAGTTLETAASAMLPPRVPDASLHQLDQLMEREPERVAAQVKAWMAED